MLYPVVLMNPTFLIANDVSLMFYDCALLTGHLGKEIRVCVVFVLAVLMILQC